MKKYLCLILLALVACSQPAQTPTSQALSSPVVPEVASTQAVPASTQPVVLTSTPTTFVLPTAVPTLTPTNPPVEPSATPACQDGLRYITDLTVPDGTVVNAGEPVDKRWQVQNSGTCNWDERYRLRRVSGPELGVPDELAIYPARSGTEAVIRLVFTAPDQPGTYRSAWQAVNAVGEAFGDIIYAEFIIN